MPLDDLLGRRATLRIRRLATSGAYLAREQDADRDAILLPGAQVHPGANVGDEVDVFVHRDAEGRPLAMRRVAKLELGQVAFLEVTALSSFGAFVDWGLPKELLVPFAEQTAEMRVCERYAIGLYLDSSGRLAGTMRAAEMVGRPDAQIAWEPDEWVEGEAWRDDPEIGLFVIVEKELVGLVPRVEPHSLSRGDAPRIGDRSSPEEIRRLLGLSKKAFKRAAGRLLKEGAVSLDGEGFLTRAR